MKEYKRFPIWVLVLVLILLGMSCSKAKSPVEPGNIENLPDSFGIAEGAGNHQAVAVYDLIIDPVNQTVTLVPSTDRAAEYHIPLSNYYPNVLAITGYGWTPNFWADIRLKHPFPGSGIDGFDARVIAVIPAKAGFSMIYPVLSVGANNSVVMYPDGYTKLFDNTSIPGNANPFMAYFAIQPNRVWSSTGITEETMRWDLKLTGFGGPIQYQLVVDVSTNYPSPPNPVIDNAKEPVKIRAMVGEGLTPTGGSAPIDVTILDWQGTGGTNVLVEAPAIFDGIVNMVYAVPGPNPDEYIYTAIISNTKLAPAGEYRLLVGAVDNATGVYMYREFACNVVDEIPSNLVDETPPWINFSPEDVQIQGNYAYLAGGVTGFHIFDLSDKFHPQWISNLPVSEGPVVDVCLSGNYAFLIAKNYWMLIVDISDPYSPGLVNEIQMGDLFTALNSVSVVNGMAYVNDSYSAFYIFDIDPPETAYAVNYIDLAFTYNRLCASNGYLFLVGELGMEIWDVDPPTSPQLVKDLALDYIGYDIAISNGYAYVADGFKMSIVDIEPASSAYLVNSIASTGNVAVGVSVYGQYAYLACEYGGMNIIDISNPLNLSIIGTISESTFGISSYALGDVCCLADNYDGLYVIDITTPTSAYISGKITTPGTAYSVMVNDSISVVTNRETGLQIFTNDPPQNADFITQVDTPGNAITVFLDSDYAYVADNDHGIQVIDINPPGSASIVKSISFLGNNDSILVKDGYAYAGSDDLNIIDVDPLDSAHVVKNIYTSGFVTDTWIQGDYAYLADYGSGLIIINITDPTNAFIVKGVPTPGYAIGVCTVGDYAYVADYMDGLQIISVNPIASAHIVKTVPLPGSANDVEVKGDYAFVADADFGLQVVKINPPESAYIFSSIDTPGFSTGIFLFKNHAYIADSNGGIRTIKLW